jgi:hypothetical protein
MVRAQNGHRRLDDLLSENTEHLFEFSRSNFVSGWHGCINEQTTGSGKVTTDKVETYGPITKAFMKFPLERCLASGPQNCLAKKGILNREDNGHERDWKGIPIPRI